MNEQLIIDLMKKVEKQEADLASLRAQHKLFTILNVNQPAQLTADQNNYDPGNYDVLRMSSNAARTITGFSGGTKGRVLFLINSGTQNIILAHASALSLTVNRISTPAGINVTMAPNSTGTSSRVVLIHVGDLWMLLFESTP